MRWLWFMLLTGTALAQLPTPTIAIPAGTYTNAVFTYISGSAAGVVICVTIDGTTPSAAVAGTCDKNGSIYQSSLYGSIELDGAGTYTYQALATKSGSTNSAVASAVYTIVSAPALVTLTNTTPVKRTSSAPGLNYFMPYVVTAANGRISMFYGYGAEAPDHGKNTGIEMKFSTDDGATWSDYAPTKVTRLTITNIGSGYSTSSCALAAGAGVTATCTAGAPVNGAIPSITLTSAGAGYDVTQIPFYSHPILCNVTGGGGTGATCEAWVNNTATHAIGGVRMSSYGSGYTSTPTCSITQAANTGTATCSFGAPVNGAITTLTLTNRGTVYASPPVVTVTGTGGSGAAATANLNDCEPGDPANCFWHDSHYGYTELMGGGVSYTNTVVVTADDTELFYNSSRGPRIWRSLDNGTTWELGFNVQLAPQQTHSPANMLSIPSGSPGVTGSCSTGCLIQWTTYGAAANANYVMYSFDDGVTWTTPHAVGNPFPQNDEETSITWVGGMNLLAFVRNTRSFSNSIGWPTPMLVHYSSDLGATWQAAGVISNINTGPCTVNPDSYFWGDGFTKPNGFIDPVDSTRFTFIAGERFSCPVGSTTRWRTVTFDIASTFAAHGQNVPQSQVLDLAPGVVYGSGHTSY